MIWAIATFKVIDGKQDEFEAIMKPLVEKVRANEPGTPVYALTKSKKDPTEYVMIEQYSSSDARKAHGETPYFQEALPKFMALLSSPLQLANYLPVA
jgi:quinol monooxygenase YgiN